MFTSAARVPLTSLASVVEMTGDFSLTLPVMLAVAIASPVSRAVTYGTIYTTKLLRRGTDIDRATPWRALADLKVTDAMHPFGTVVVPAAPGAADIAAVAGPAVSQAACSPPSRWVPLCGSWKFTDVTGRRSSPATGSTSEAG